MATPVKASDMGDDLLIHFGGAIKALDEKGKVGGYLVRFGSINERDTSDEYFTKDTYLGPSDGNGAESLFHHSQPVVKGMEHLADRTFQPLSTKRDEIGIWAETVLDMADDYERKVFELAQKGKLGWSSGSAAHRVRKMADGRITSWPILEGSLTPEPAEPRNRGGILPLKSLRGITMGKSDENENKPEEKAEEKPEEKADECMASIAKSLSKVIDMLTKSQQASLAMCKAVDQFLKSKKDADGDNDGDATASRKDDTAAAEEEEATARKTEDEEEATAAKAEEESDKEFNEEYKKLSPAEKAMIDRELADIAKIQAETRRWNEIKANHQRRLWNAALGRGLLR